MLEILINIGNIISPIFYKLLYMSIIGTILGVLILVITKLFDDKISAKWKCLMWIIPLIFLMIPIQRIEIKTKNDIPIVSAVDKVEDIFSGIELSDYQTIEINSNELKQQPKTESGKIYNTTNKKQDIEEIILHTIIPILWLLGSVIGITIFVISNIGLINKIRKTEKLKNYRIKNIQRECKRKLKINKKIEIRIQKLKGSPCIYGIMNPKILVPEDFEEKEDEIVENVFMHELSHYKRKDMITNCILLVMTVIHWFNPFVYAFFKKMRQEMELATDEIALSKMNKEEKKKYGLTLINLLETYQCEEIGAKMLCITDDSKNMQRRIMRIKNSGKRAHKIISILSVLIIAIITLPFMVQATSAINDKENISITEEEFEQKKNKPFTEYNQKSTNTQNQNVENNIIDKLEGKWFPFSAVRNGKNISLREVYGSGVDIYQEGINFDSIDGTYTKYIAIYSEDDISDLQGTYEIATDGVYLTSYSRNVTRLEYAEENMLLEQLDDGIFVYFKKYNSEYSNYIDKLNVAKGE